MLVLCRGGGSGDRKSGLFYGWKTAAALFSRRGGDLLWAEAHEHYMHDICSLWSYGYYGGKYSRAWLCRYANDCVLAWGMWIAHALDLYSICKSQNVGDFVYFLSGFVGNHGSGTSGVFCGCVEKIEN